MKKNFLTKTMLFALLTAALAIPFSSCSSDSKTTGGDNIEIVLDGLYLQFDGENLASKYLMTPTVNEVGQEAREGLFETYIALTSGAKFNLVEVAGENKFVYGPGEDFSVVSDEAKHNDEPKETFSRGSISDNGATQFTVTEDALYHIAFDKELQVAVIAKAKWGMIGAATPNGWSGDLELDQISFSKEGVKLETKEITLIKGDYKFRYSGGWKIFLDGEAEEVAINTNVGGTLDKLVPGGDNIVHETPGIYTVTVSWTLTDGVTASLTKSGDYTPPAYPEEMFVVGEGTAYGWDEPGTKEDAVMHKIAGGGDNDGIFWKICYLEAATGFKISAAKWANPNLGVAEVTEFDAEGVEVTEDGGNMTVAESGMYMIVLDLRNDETKVSIKPAVVYGIGGAFGGWDASVEANKFTVDNAAKTFTSPALSADAPIRIHTSHAWIPDWWHAEFVVRDGAIEYRNDGGDLEDVDGTTGQVITLSFDDNTGTVQ